MRHLKRKEKSNISKYPTTIEWFLPFVLQKITPTAYELF